MMERRGSAKAEDRGVSDASEKQQGSQCAWSKSQQEETGRIRQLGPWGLIT